MLHEVRNMLLIGLGWRSLCSGMLHRVVSRKLADAWQVLTASIITAISRVRSDDGDSKHLWNVGQFLWDYTVQHPGRQSSFYTPPWEPELAQDLAVSDTSCWWRFEMMLCTLCLGFVAGNFMTKRITFHFKVGKPRSQPVHWLSSWVWQIIIL
jgi:hypothetical protein